MARDEIEARRRRGNFHGPTGKSMTDERRRDRESAPDRAGGTGRIISPEEEAVPRKTPGTDRDKKENELEPGGM